MAGMFPDAFIPLGQVPATANRLQRAAGELQQAAGSPCAVPSLPVTLAHVEEALDQLADSMKLMAEAVDEWCGKDAAIVDEDTLPPEARALLWHLRAVADTLIDSRDDCSVTREWARRLLGDAEYLGPAATDTRRPSRRLAPAGDPGPRTVEAARLAPCPVVIVPKRAVVERRTA
jgi:hypothetical protein